MKSWKMDSISVSRCVLPTPSKADFPSCYITRMKRGQHIFRKSGMPRKIFTVLFSSELLLQSEEMSAFYFLLVVKNPKP